MVSLNVSGGVDGHIGVEALANGGDGGERRADFEGDAREDQLLAAGRGDGVGDLRIVECVDQRAIDDRDVRQCFDELREGRTHMLSRAVVVLREERFAARVMMGRISNPPRLTLDRQRDLSELRFSLSMSRMIP